MSKIATFLCICAKSFVLTLIPLSGFIQSKEPSVRLERISLFPDGQGIFEYSANAGTEWMLSLSREELDDALKSLVVEGFDDVQIEYASSMESLKSGFQEDPTTTLGEMIQGFRGKLVSLLQAEKEVLGIVVGVEMHSEQLSDNRWVDQEWVTLLNDGVLTRTPLMLDTKVKWHDPDIEKQFRNLASENEVVPKKKTQQVKLKLLGADGTRGRFAMHRMVAPWKISYRIEEHQDNLTMSAAAIIDNTTDTDWENVQLRLVVDQPLGFRSPLSEIQKPIRDTLELPSPFSNSPPMLAGRPVTPRAFELASDSERMEAPIAGLGMGGMGGGMGGMGGGMGGMSRVQESMRPVSPEESRYGLQMRRNQMRKDRIGPRVQMDLNQFELPSGKSKGICLPLIPHAIRDLRIWVPSVSKDHPLCAFEIRLLNNYQLPSGPGTVWNMSGYQGDVLIPPLNSYQTSLLSYAMDGSISVDKSIPAKPEEDPFAVSTANEDPFAVNTTDEYRWIKVNEQGVLYIQEEFQQKRTVRYKITNQSNTAKFVLIEHRQEDVNWVPQDALESLGQGLYRYSIRIPPNTIDTLPVTEISSHLNRYSNRSELSQLIAMTMKPGFPAPFRDIAQAWIEQGQKREANNRQIQTLTHKKSVCDQQQTRIKSLMSNLNPETELYKRYLEKLADLEDEQEQIAERLIQLQEEARQSKTG